MTTTRTGPDTGLTLITTSAVVQAGDRTGLLEQIVPGYRSDMSIEDSALARHGFMRSLAAQANEVRLARAVEADGFDLRSLTEDQINLLLGNDVEPLEGEWDAGVAIILIRSDYAPHTNVPLPTGQVSFLDPTNESTFLASLVNNGLARMEGAVTES